MAKFDIYRLEVGFAGHKGSKERYAVIVDELPEFVFCMDSITSQFEKKSDFIKAQYYPVKDWRSAGLTKASYIDILSQFEKSFLELTRDAAYIGKLSSADQRGLYDFLKSYNLRISQLKNKLS